MAILNKTQLEAVNVSNFPDNTSGLITPALLRDFNTDVIDSMALNPFKIRDISTFDQNSSGLNVCYV